MRVLRRIALACALLLPAAARAQEPVRLVAAGSLTASLGEVAQAFAAMPGGAPVVTRFGPSGLMREGIEAGAIPADVFFSASLDHAQRLERDGRTVAPAVIFVRNRLCLITRPGLTVPTGQVLDALLDSAVKLGTSTPRADPSGDYAWALFRRAELLRPGAQAALEAKALQLVGGPNSPTPPAGIGAVAWNFRAGRMDVFLGYCTSGALARAELPGIGVQDLPEALAVGADYGMALLSGRPEAVRLSLFALSPAGQAILARHGFAAVAAE
ncbi:substrate-binding domain-containing protein [Neoroseomonas alba]|nr:substrate-binding domain-containing protein [Neoroseomonas alba]